MHSAFAPTLPIPGRRAGKELLLIAVLFAAYKLGRVLAADHVATAFLNADRLWELERTLRLPNEARVQDWLLAEPRAVRAANVYYKFAHFPVTAAFLVWLYLKRPAHYRWSRRVLVVLTGLALAVHFAVPLAPPRMLGGLGFVDTGALYGPAVYGSPESDQLANQFAAMPSLHVGWAVLVAAGIIVATSGRLRWLIVLHPLITTFVVVATANHYWLDGIVATAVLVVTIVTLRPPKRSVPDAHRRTLDFPTGRRADAGGEGAAGDRIPAPSRDTAAA
ncbi:phosphatase PAP2 family protein [Actinomadura rudentiformis]|uniref:Inositol phosphorylceramide synthase n=1 Tax=Actinomadura rudentiformis TaxID=359158 RepID=A0A6H9YF65_9ACTN|nr:phosphatase PAP2 family protein [Actinomadura rudentiformis]KAB2344075.1 inositol phosphorylceramide synthase [Actinomadura rudentiformis]